MEDLSRDLQADQGVDNPKPRRRPSSRWTLLLVGDLGRIVSCRITKPFLVSMTGVLTALLAVSSYSLLSYTTLHSEKRQLAKDLQEMEKRLETAEAAKENALVRLIMLEDKGKGPAGKTAPASEPKRQETVSEAARPTPQAQTAADETAPGPEPPARAKGLDAETTPKMLVKDPIIWFEPEENVFKFQFSLSNVDRGDVRLAGFTFFVLRPANDQDGSCRSFPWSSMQDGKPDNHKKGQYFSIAHFKYVRGTLRDIEPITHYETATIYVYEDNGELLAENVFKVSKLLRSSGPPST